MVSSDSFAKESLPVGQQYQMKRQEKASGVEAVLMRAFAWRDLRLGFTFDQILCDAAEEERHLLLGHRDRQRIAEVILMRMILGRVFAALFALGDDVMLERYAILVRLCDHEL